LQQADFLDDHSLLLLELLVICRTAKMATSATLRTKSQTQHDARMRLAAKPGYASTRRSDAFLLLPRMLAKRWHVNRG
jgi:hypothetical protein